MTTRPGQASEARIDGVVERYLEAKAKRGKAGGTTEDSPQQRLDGGFRGLNPGVVSIRADRRRRDAGIRAGTP
ncbi:hypothetical protein [Haloquadratum walsbyi]|uniref:hypothetical protein n=1 Tax=Haloquadratum walsbyi TaxID=293091 RepID=UPI0026EFD60F|nr:hypothetical protein [Haloquadratum walsbyi]